MTRRILIVGAYRPIKIGDMLMPYVGRMNTVSLHPTPPGIEGNIIVSEEHQSIFGETTVAFITGFSSRKNTS